MEQPIKRKKPVAAAQPQWRVRAPVSKADRDAIHVFKRSIDILNSTKKKLLEADAGVEKAFAELKRRGQIEFLTEPGPGTAT
jgi:hypothetical protein